ncbi:MAG: hypothetical protein QF858_01505 [Candidatus Pacebacteria bacterium]|jgi:hypothetical protein|nr:hypothetical protein [Candidatus Paceibacterota bacterium]
MNLTKNQNHKRNYKKRNPIAKELRTPRYRQRTVKSKTVYNRKDEETWTPIKGLLQMLLANN